MRSFQESVINRRTNYKLDKNIKVLPSEIVAAVERLMKEVPTAFNMQSSRIVVAMGDHHQKIWDITRAELQKIVPADKFSGTDAKLKGFESGFGTILFFDEMKTVEEMQNQFKLYAENFPIWASQANGMIQFAIWTELANLGLGVNLQHYNPLIDAEIKKYFDVPDSWKLVAQMVFGNPIESPAPIEKLPIEQRVKIFA